MLVPIWEGLLVFAFLGLVVYFDLCVFMVVGLLQWDCFVCFVMVICFACFGGVLLACFLCYDGVWV